MYQRFRSESVIICAYLSEVSIIFDSSVIVLTIAILKVAHMTLLKHHAYSILDNPQLRLLASFCYGFKSD